MSTEKTPVDEYILRCPEEQQLRLHTMKRLIREACPESSEKISWGMPTFSYKGKNLAHFASHKNHIGFYPGPEAIKHFEEKLSDCRTSKGAVQLSMAKPLPEALVKEMAAFRMEEIKAEAET